MTVSKRTEDGWIDDLVGALLDPIIVYPSGWQGTLTDWIKPQIAVERLIMNMKVAKEGGVPVGNTEVLAYIYPRTLEAPMSEQWFRIYMFVFTQAMEFRKTEVPEDLKSEGLSDSDTYQLNHLKRWIYERRVKNRKEKARGEIRESRRAKEESKDEVLEFRKTFF